MTVTEERNWLVKEAETALSQEPSAVQVTVFETADEEIVPFYLFDLADTDGEKALFDRLKSDHRTQIRHVLTMWNNRTVDAPKRSLLKGLLDLDEANSDTCVLLNGENGINGFQLSRLV